MDADNLPKSVQDFLGVVASECKHHAVAFLLEPTSRVQYADTAMRVSGYFIDRPKPVLRVGTDKPLDQWLGVLTHEFCHMRQWLEDSPAWSGVFMEDGREAGDWLDDWIQGQDLPPERVKQIIAAVQQVEHDCEARVLQAIDEFDLPLDRDTYARRANAYVHFYQHIGKSRQWYEDGRAPYEIDAVVDAMPGDLVDVDKGMPPSMAAVFDANYPTPTPRRPGM